MKQMIQLTIMASFLVNAMAAGDAGDSPNFIDGQYLDFAVYPVYETILTPAPSRDSIQLIAARISNNPLSVLEIL